MKPLLYMFFLLIYSCDNGSHSTNTPTASEKQKNYDDIKNIAIDISSRANAFVAFLQSDEDTKKLMTLIPQVTDREILLTKTIERYCANRDMRKDLLIKEILSKFPTQLNKEYSAWIARDQKNNDLQNINDFILIKECFSFFGYEIHDQYFEKWWTDPQQMLNIAHSLKENPELISEEQNRNLRKLVEINPLFIDLADIISSFNKAYAGADKSQIDQFTQIQKQQKELVGKRNSLADELKEESKDVKTIRGIIVALVNDDESIKSYEFDNGYGQRGILHMSPPGFTSKGWFTLRVKSLGLQSVKLKEGAGSFTQSWPTYTEASAYIDKAKELLTLKKEASELEKQLKVLTKSLLIFKRIDDFEKKLSHKSNKIASTGKTKRIPAQKTTVQKEGCDMSKDNDGTDWPTVRTECREGDEKACHLLKLTCNW